jgi:hypothetical protein
MKHNVLVAATILTFIMLLTACRYPPIWRVAERGQACMFATVIEKQWFDRENFYLLLKAKDGEIGEAVVNVYTYTSLQIGDVTCVIR